MDSFNSKQAALMLTEYGNWLRGQRERGIGFPNKSAIASKVRGIEHGLPENNNIKLIDQLLSVQPVLKKVAICKYAARKKCSIEARAKYLNQQGVDVGKTPSTRQNKVKMLEVQLESYVQGIITQVDMT